MRIILILTLFISIQTFAQNPPGYQSRIVRERIQGSFMVDSSLHVPRYCGTPSGVRVGGSVQDGAMAIDTCNSILYFYSEGVWKRAGTEDIKCGLTCASCGIVTWTGFGLNFNASEAWYNLDGASYHFSGDSISLDAADGSFGRFDAITLSSTGLSKITGTASSDPQLPQYDPCTNVLLTYVFVGAGVTTPAATISDEVIYDENNETWTHATGGTISANFSSNVSSSHGDTSIRVASWSTNATITFTAPGTLLVNNYTTLSFWVKISAIMTNNQNISIQFFNGTTAISNQVQAQITKGNITTWQSASFNMPQFTFTGSSFTSIKFNFSGSQSNVTFIDWVRLQAGVTQPQPPSGLSSAYGRMTDGSNLATSTGSDIFMLRSSLPLRNVVTNNDATYGDNILQSVDTSRALSPSLATNAIVKKQVDSLGTLISSGGRRFGVSGEDAIGTQNRTYTGNNNTYYLALDSLNYFRVDRNGVTRIYMDNTISALYSPDAADAVQVYNNGIQLSLNTGDSLWSTILPYNSSARLVGMAQDTVTGRWYRQTGGSGVGVTDGDKGDITVSSSGTVWDFDYKRNMIYTVSVGTNANITAAAGTAYSLPAATLSTDRTIDMTNLNTNGDYIEIDNQEAGFTWSFTGQIVYDAYETAVTVLFANTRYIIRRTNGKLKIIN